MTSCVISLAELTLIIVEQHLKYMSTYGSPFDMMKSFGISYKSAGENIAKGQTSAAQVM